MRAIDQRRRAEGGIVGLLVGDALGVPYEFQAAAQLPPREALELAPPPGFARSHAGVPPGTWSDDGAQALCLLDSWLAVGRFDAADFARRLVRWYDEGYLAVDGAAFDVGVQTGTALRELAAGGPALRTPGPDERGPGNGALMRVLPLALVHPGSDAELARDARLSSRVTHPHLRSQLCCALYVLWARGLARAAPDPWAAATAQLRAQLAAAGEDDAIAELEMHIRPDDEPRGQGSGYVVDSLRTARALLAREPDYEGVVRGAVALGGDTDTTAAIAGGLAGVRDGLAGIPARWRAALRGRELLEPLLTALAARAIDPR